MMTGLKQCDAASLFGGASSFVTPVAPPLPKTIITKTDVEESLENLELLGSAAKKYRNSLSDLASSASTLGAALEKCARCKGARSGHSGDGLLAVSGLQQVKG